MAETGDVSIRHMDLEVWRAIRAEQIRLGLSVPEMIAEMWRTYLILTQEREV